jgi:hypothetical protein
MKLERLAAGAAGAGLLLIVLSFAWPHLANRGPGAWTEEKAEQHARTRAELHAAAHARIHGHDSEEAARARELQERFEAELSELDAARSRGEDGARLIWWIGAAMAIGGGGLYFLARASS